MSHGLPGHLVDFVAELRRHQVLVGPGETVDAAQVMGALDLLEREQLREGLASALLRRSGQRETFDALFELWFPPALGAGAATIELPRVEQDEQAPVDVDAVRDLLVDLLRDDDTDGQRELVRGAVEAIGTSGATGRAVRGAASRPNWSAYHVLQALAPDTLLARILDGLRQEGETGAQSEIRRREIRDRIARFRGMVYDDVRRRTAEQRGRESVTRSGVPRQTDRIEFLTANAVQLTELRRTVHPLARRLASRLSVRRKHSHRGQLDLRRTLRRSMSTGGVPMTPAYRTRRPGRPDLVVLCDVSGSVAGFSQFTLLLVQALREQFSKVRVFAFVERADEVTHMFTPGADLSGVVGRVLREARLTAFDGHSDYGRALGDVVEQYEDALTPRTSLLVLGDARTNFRDPNLAALATMRDRTRHTHWLNPEPNALWGNGDSAAKVYGDVVPMHECRTVAQLADVVEALLPV